MSSDQGIPLRCVLLFARTASGEARAKRLGRARGLFALARRRVVAAVAALPGTDLLVAGPGGGLPQRGGSFGERLANAFADARSLGYQEIVAVPTDVPLLGPRQIAAAFRRLRETGAVLGPSPDGGVYLIGCGTDPGPLLAGVRWRTPRVFSDLVANAGAPAVLAPLRDVDRRSDLLPLAGDPELDRELAELVARLLLGGGPSGVPEDARLPVPVLLTPPSFSRPPPLRRPAVL